MVYIDIKRVPIPQHLGILHIASCKVGLQHTEVLRHVVIQAEYPVSCPEAHLLRKLACINRAALVLKVSFSPYTDNRDIAHYREYEVVEHAADHNQQTLPTRVGAEFPRLGVLLELLEVHRLIDHPADLAVSAEREPAYAEFGFPILSRGEQLEEPFLSGTE